MPNNKHQERHLLLGEPNHLIPITLSGVISSIVCPLNGSRGKLPEKVDMSIWRGDISEALDRSQNDRPDSTRSKLAPKHAMLSLIGRVDRCSSRPRWGTLLIAGRFIDARKPSPGLISCVRTSSPSLTAARTWFPCDFSVHLME